MNNNDIYTVDFTRSLPPALRQDPKMIALAKAVAEQMTITAEEIRLNIIYARFDELDEQTLDVLAYDLHVDWYDYTYPIEAKRAIVKDSVKVHKRMGTKYAVETALGNIHPHSYIEEWWQYGGEPYYFRVVLDTAYSRAPVGYYEITRAINKYKRLTAHMESIVYQCGIGIEIHTGTRFYRNRGYMTGQHSAGTLPHRNTGGAVHFAGLEIEPDAQGYLHISQIAGTYPDRNTKAVFRRSGVEVDPDARGFPYSAAMAGTDVAGMLPYKNTGGAISGSGLEVEPDAQGYLYEFQLTGTHPDRSTESIFRRSGLEVDPDARGFPYSAAMTGTEIAQGGSAVVPYGTLQTTATLEGFKYRVKRCGTSCCKT